MDDDIDQSGDKDLRFTIRNRFQDIYIGNVYLQCMNHFIWFFLAIFLWNGYHFSLPLLIMKEYALFGFSLARNLLIMAVFFFTTPLVFIAAFAVMKRLKGVVGEHEYIFGPDSFTKNSAKNRLTLSYESVVRFYETRKHFLLIMPNMNGFIIPKRDLSAEVKVKMRELLKKTKPAKITMKATPPEIMAERCAFCWLASMILVSGKSRCATPSTSPICTS